MQPSVRVRDAEGLRNAVQLVKGLDTETEIPIPASNDRPHLDTASLPSYWLFAEGLDELPRLRDLIHRHGCSRVDRSAD
jgi:hypothetical protein